MRIGSDLIPFLEAAIQNSEWENVKPDYNDAICKRKQTQSAHKKQYRQKLDENVSGFHEIKFDTGLAGLLKSFLLRLRHLKSGGSPYLRCLNLESTQN